jgi:hypothetical protein
MDTTVIEVRKNVTISVDLNNQSSFTHTVNSVQFIPDEVIIKNIMYNPNATDGNTYKIYVDIISDVICIMVSDEIVRPEMHFPLKKSINQLWTFLIQDYDNSAGSVSGQIFLQLEFVKYKEVKEQKVY